MSLLPFSAFANVCKSNQYRVNSEFNFKDANVGLLKAIVFETNLWNMVGGNCKGIKSCLIQKMQN